MAASAAPAGLVLALARLFDAELRLRDAAEPWLYGELVAPMAQLKYLADQLTAVNERAAELYAELRATYWMVKAEYERGETAVDA